MCWGSANKPRSPRNPFTDAERREMILAAMDDIDTSLGGRLRFVSVRDCYDDSRWLAAVEHAVSEVTGATARRIGVVGHVKDISSKYLRGFRRWPLVEAHDVQGLSVSDLRAAFLCPENVQGNRLLLSTSVSRRVLAFLEAFRALLAHRELVEAQAWALQDRAKWPKTPYPVLTNTVDAVVRCRGHVLMIKRRHFPGRGLWALPGGHVDEYELLDDAVLRELEEEAGLGMTPGYLELHLRGTYTFDYPWRSQRGRVITHGYYFELELRELPPVIGSDDTAEARWIAEADLPGMESCIHDDHLEIINHFLTDRGASHRHVATISKMSGSTA